uniref:endo-polygalacturonase n=1 Tax=Apolygus lucorum TaxID=248454 RepID=V9LL01_APOLU|nr:polygalacturonase 8 [Apolygus lucorum]
MNRWLSLLTLAVMGGVVLGSDYTIKTIADVKDAHQYRDIVISNLHVPAGVPLVLLGLQNAVVTFEGTTTFGYKEWKGHLMMFKGDNVTVTGSPGHLIHCGGERWWDGRGGLGGTKKPKFFEVRLNNSQIIGLKIKNTPMHAISINHSYNLTVSNLDIDNLEGDWKGGHNTDGFNVYESKNVTIRNCTANNQNDCIAVKSGIDLLFEDHYCSGGHGISIGSVGGRRDNIVERATIRNCFIRNSVNGVRVKTVRKAIGRVTNVTFEDVTLANITQFGVTMIGNYNLAHGDPHGEPTGGVPISGLVLKNVVGTVNPKGTNIWVYVTNATDWSWDIDVTGGTKTRTCEGFPDGMTPLC